jgi:hypothetical protein
MHIRDIDREHARIVRQKVLIVRQQELTAKLHRAGKNPKARAAREKLYGMLNRLDALETIASGERTTNNDSLVEFQSHRTKDSTP